MKAKRFFVVLLSLLCCMFVFSACTDPYKNYVSAGLEAKAMPTDYMGHTDDYYSLCGKAIILTDYDDYAEWNFRLDYTKAFFENNDLLVFAVSGCSSDRMRFEEILIDDDGKLYPLFSRNKYEDGDAATCDFIVFPYCVELAKADNYEVGEIVYRYR